MAVTPVVGGPRAGHLNALLGQLSVEYRPTNARLIVDTLFPTLMVEKENDSFAVWDKGQRFRLSRTDGLDFMRADGTRALQQKYGWTYDNYVAQEHSLEFYLTDRELANADAGLQLMLAHSNGVSDSLLLAKEIRVASLLTATGNYASGNSTTLAGANQWNNASFASQSAVTVSTIKKNIDTGKEAIRSATGGQMPTHIVLPEPVAQTIERDLGVVDMLKHNGGITDLVSNGYPLAQGNKFFGMEVLRPSSTYQSENEGETAVVADVWGKNVIMAIVGPAAQRTITFGLQFVNKPFGQLKSYREEGVDSTFYRFGSIQTEKIIANTAGYLIAAAIA